MYIFIGIIIYIFIGIVRVGHDFIQPPINQPMYIRAKLWRYIILCVLFWPVLMYITMDLHYFCQYFKKADKSTTEDADAVGYRYYNGIGVQQDYCEAAKWYTKAAEQGGDANVMVILGSMYYEGTGVTRDNVIAYLWFSLASAQGNVDGRKMIHMIKEEMTPEQIIEAQKLAIEFTKKTNSNTITSTS